MADIQSKILSKYGIDIAQENIFKLYKIENADISQQDLEEKIKDTHKRWNSSINGANEKNAERDRTRMEKADKYEAILKDAKLRKEVFKFCNKAAGTGGGAASGSGSTEFAKEYFELIATTKKIRKADVDFFFKYYQSERKNKKAILEMLSKELKVNGLGKEEKNADEGNTKGDDEDKDEGKKKDSSSPLIVNLFQEVTVLKIRRAIEKYEEAYQSNEVCLRYPDVRNGLYEFLGIGNVDDAKQFKEIMAAKGKEAYAIRQEKGTEYVPLVDMYNILLDIGDYQDVADNIPEFKLLLKYPNLTPYMFSFVEMKPSTIKKMVYVANRDYVFRDDTDFILNYYKPIYDNFGISNSGIGTILRNAEKKAKQNKFLNDIDEKLGRNKNKRKIPIGAEIIHWLVYWPIFAVYFVFEVAKAIFTELHRFAIPVFIILFVLENCLLPKVGIDNLLILRKLFLKNQWLSYLRFSLGNSGVNMIETFLLSFKLIISLLAIYAIPALLMTIFVSEFADDLNKRFDWIGIERTFQHIFQVLRRKTEDQYLTQKKLFIKRKIGKIIINLLSLIMLIAIIIFIPISFRKYSYGTEDSQNTIEPMYYYETVFDEVIAEENTDDENNLSNDVMMVITVSSANIRSGPNADYGVVVTANQGDEFLATGNQETASNGRVWYEIYLDVDKTQLGWASQKVIDFQ